jgi:hypothetical protein
MPGTSPGMTTEKSKRRTGRNIVFTLSNGSTQTRHRVLAAQSARVFRKGPSLQGRGRREHWMHQSHPRLACKKEMPQARRNTGTPCASGLRLMSRSPRGTGLVSPRHPCGVSGPPGPTSPVHELDTSIGVPGPRDFAVRCLSSFACDAGNVHRIPHPTFRDDGEAPLRGGGTGKAIGLFLPRRQAQIMKIGI